MKIALITSNELRHLYFVNKISELINVDFTFLESKKKTSKSLRKTEKKYFIKLKDYSPKMDHLFINSGEINEQKTYNFLNDLALDFIFTFGCSLLKPKIFKIPRYGTINIHTGLVQNYRGVDSSMWAAYDNNFELIGSTIHYIDNTIDGGKIIDQKRIDLSKLSKDDKIDDLFIKTCISGIDLLYDNIKNILNFKNNPKNINLKSKGELYQSKDKNLQILNQAENNLANYLSSKKLSKNLR